MIAVIGETLLAATRCWAAFGGDEDCRGVGLVDDEVPEAKLSFERQLRALNKKILAKDGADLSRGEYLRCVGDARRGKQLKIGGTEISRKLASHVTTTMHFTIFRYNGTTASR